MNPTGTHANVSRPARTRQRSDPFRITPRMAAWLAEAHVRKAETLRQQVADVLGALDVPDEDIDAAVDGLVAVMEGGR